MRRISLVDKDSNSVLKEDWIRNIIMSSQDYSESNDKYKKQYDTNTSKNISFNDSNGGGICFFVFILMLVCHSTPVLAA